MHRPVGSQTQSTVELVPRLACVAACAIAVLALAGWQFGLPILTSVVPGYKAMNPVSALCFVLASASLWIKLRTKQDARAGWSARAQWPAQAGAALVAGIGAFRLVSLLPGIALPIDQLLFRAQMAASPLPTRMAPNTSIAFVCLGLGLLSLDFRARRGWRIADPFLFATIGLSMVAVVGYLYSAASMHGIMALNTAVALLLLSTAALFGRPDRGLCRLLLSDSPGGAMARRVVLPAIVIPLVLGWLRLLGQRAGFFGLEMGTGLVTLAIVGILVGLIWMTGQGLDAAHHEQRRAEEALRTSLERQSRLLETNLIGVLTADAQGLITEANAAFLDMVGYSPEDLPLTSASITPPEWRGHTDTAIRQIAERGMAIPFEKEYLRKDGRRVPALVGAAALPGIPQEIMAFVVDLSGKQRAELEMERMRNFLDSVVENLPNMVFVKDAAELRFVQLNRAGEDLLGFSRQELLAKNDYDFFPKEEADFFTSKDRAVLVARQMLDIPEESIRTRNGETRFLHTKKVPIYDREGTPQYLLGISEDITERKRAEREVVTLNEGLRLRTEELEAANKELEAFSYSVSHDLRAPLRHIDGFADLLVRHAGSELDEKGRRYLDIISSSAKSMGELIDDLLQFSRMSRSQMQSTTVDLDRLIAEVRQGLAEEVAGREIEWRIGSLPKMEGDVAMLRVMFTNLLANAVKYTSRRPKSLIEVGTRESDSEIIVFVRDDGAGFDMQYAHKLFGVFQRLHRDDEFEGTGIGLANVRRVVHRHGGRVWAEGAVDAGATFYVALPRPTASDEMKEAA